MGQEIKRNRAEAPLAHQAEKKEQAVPQSMQLPQTKKPLQETQAPQMMQPFQEMQMPQMMQPLQETPTLQMMQQFQEMQTPQVMQFPQTMQMPHMMQPHQMPCVPNYMCCPFLMGMSCPMLSEQSGNTFPNYGNQGYGSYPDMMMGPMAHCPY